MKIFRQHKTKAGFTLLEVMVATFIGALIIGSFIIIENLLISGQNTLTTSSQSYNEATISLQAITRELRNVRAAANGAYPLELANDQEIIFYANIDADTQPERIRYFIDGTSLKRGVIQPSGNPYNYNQSEEVTLVISYINNGNNPIFSYYNGDWPIDTTNNPLPAPARLTDTKMVTVSITINPTPQRMETAYHLESSVQLRNLKTNL